MNDNKFLVSLVINFIVAILFISFFLIFRKRSPNIYQPRCTGKPGDPLPPSPTLFGWIGSTLKYSDETLFRTHGLDVVMFLKFARTMLLVVGIIFVFGWAILIPIFATADNSHLTASDLDTASGLSRLTMSMLQSNSHRLWAPLISVIFNSLVVYYFSYATYKQYLGYRLRHKVSRRNENFSVMFTNIPDAAGDENQLRGYFETLFPNEVVTVVRARNTPALEKYFAKRGQVLRKMEGAFWTFNKTGKRPQNKEKSLIGRKVDSMEYYSAKYNQIQASIAENQRLIHEKTGVVFVTFNSIQTAMKCSRLVLAPYNQYQPHIAPEARDILWKNLNISPLSFLIRCAIAMVGLFFLVVFAMIGVAFVASIANLNTLASVPAFHFLSHLESLSPVITGFIEGFLPTLILLIFFVCLGPLIRLACRLQGFYTFSSIDCSVLHKYHLFLVYNVFLIYSIAGTAFGVLESVIKNPSMIPNLLATSLPQQSFFFINYIMILSFGSQSKALGRPFVVLIVWLKMKYFSKSPRDLREAQHPGIFRFSIPTATHLLIFLITLFYSTIAPFILLFGLIYFGMVYLVSRYNLIYVYIPKYEGGGYLWPSIFHRIMVAVLIYQLALVGEFGLFKFTAGAIISGLMGFVTIAFWYLTHNRFKTASEYGAINELLPAQIHAEKCPLDAHGITIGDEEAILNKNIYLQPTLQTPKPRPELPGQPNDEEDDTNNPSLNYGLGSGVASLATDSALGGGGHM